MVGNQSLASCSLCVNGHCVHPRSVTPERILDKISNIHHKNRFKTLVHKQDQKISNIHQTFNNDQYRIRKKLRALEIKQKGPTTEKIFPNEPTTGNPS